MNHEKELLIEVLDEIIILAKEMREDAIFAILITLKASILGGEDDLSRLAQVCNGFSIAIMIKRGVDPIVEINKVKAQIKKAKEN